MPRGGHFGLWKPTPKDIFKSRWKRFYKRCHRYRSKSNQPDRAGPHPQPVSYNDGVPSPWRLLFSQRHLELGPKGERTLPPDLKPYGIQQYRQNEKMYLTPWRECQDTSAQTYVLRCLDPGRRGGADSGYGRLETKAWLDEKYEVPEHITSHIYNLVKPDLEAEREKEDDSLAPILKGPAVETFPVRRLQELLEEWYLVWEDGQKDPRKERVVKGKAGDEDTKEVDRGRFPYIDEQAGLLDDVVLADILRLNHRIKSRRHPKWKEIQYEFKKGHRQYLRRKRMMDDEAKARMGVMRQALADA